MSIPDEAVEAAEQVFDERFEIGQAFGPDSIRAMLEAAAPSLLRNAVAAELAELAELIEPYSGVGLANDATRSDIAQWIRKRAETYRPAT